LIDTHCHLTFKQFEGCVEAVVERSRAAGVTGWITVGTDTQDNRKAIALAEKFDGMYAAVGIHPHEAKDVTAGDLDELKKSVQNKKVVAIGETGLDFHYNFSKQDAQRRLFIEHLKIAAERRLPVIVHSREAFDETLEIIGEYGRGIEKIVFHCFSGSAEQAQMVLEKGYFISFTGVVTFKNAEKTRLAGQVVPVNRLMLETDCPYMSPEPMRKQKINEPGLMIHTARFLAGLKNMDLNDFAAAVMGTSRGFFSIGGGDQG